MLKIAQRMLTAVKQEFNDSIESKDITLESKQQCIKAIKTIIGTKINACQTPEEKQKIITTANLAIELIQQHVNCNSKTYFNAHGPYNKDIDSDFLYLLIDSKNSADNKKYLETICVQPSSIFGDTKLNNWGMVGINYTASATELRKWLKFQSLPKLEQLKEFFKQKKYTDQVQARILKCYMYGGTELNLSGCSLQEIPSEIFTFFPQLIKLEVNSNQISTIKANAFAGLNSLKELNLNSNHIYTIQANAFAGLNSLRVLNLSNNKIQTLEANTFAGLSSLEVLCLASNQIGTIKSNAFAGLDSLQELDLSENKIRTLEANAFVGLNSLRVLNLSKNHIHTIKANAFTGLGSLQVLWLRENQIRTREANAFAGLNSLEEVYLNAKTVRIDDVLRKIMLDSKLHKCIKLSDNNMEIDKSELMKYYIHNNDDSSLICEAYCLNLLRDQRLFEPQVLSKIATRIAEGHIKIAATGLGIQSFIKLSTTTNIPLIKYLLADLPYFINKHGLEYIKKLIENNILVEPLQHNQIEESAKKELISQLQAFKSDIDIELIREQIIPIFCDGSANTEIIKEIKEKIKDIVKNSTEDRFKNISETELDNLAKDILKANEGIQAPSPLQKSGRLMHNIKSSLYNQEELTELQEENVIKFAKQLADIDIEEMQKKYVKENYCSLLGIDSSQSENAYKVIRKYLKWNTVIDEHRANNINEITQQIMAKDQQVREASEELYYTYVLNTLPYRSYSNILTILKDKNIPDVYRQKLELVACYCQLNNFDEDDTGTLNVFVVEDKTTKANSLVHLKELDYLNSKNITGFTLEQFTVNYFNDLNYQKLTDLLNESTNLNDDAIIDCSGLDSALINNLGQLKSNNQLNPDIDKFIAVLVATRKISKADLRAIVNDATVKKYLKEVESQSLGLNHLSGISLPGYLHSLISDKFSAANIVAKHISLAIKDIISVNGIKISLAQGEKLDEVCYQVALNPGKDISLSDGFNMKLNETFKDPQLLDGEKEREENGVKVIVKAGDYVQLASHLSNGLAKHNTESLRLEALPKILVEKAKTLQFTHNIDKIIEELFNELNLLPDLKGKITIEEIEYILGIIFMDMSSIHALGYHVGSANVAFVRFRLLGAYCLAKAICQNDQWSLAEKEFISRQIKQSILDVECSGMITNRLYGEYCNNAIKNIYNKAKQILQARMIL